MIRHGRLCRMHGFVYVQHGAQDPVLYDNNFTQGPTLRIRNDVPFMLPELTNEPMLKTPVNSPSKDYDAKTAHKEMQDIIQAKAVQESKQDSMLGRQAGKQTRNPARARSSCRNHPQSVRTSKSRIVLGAALSHCK